MIAAISPEVVAGLLFVAFGLMFVAATLGRIHLGRLTLHPGWLGFSIWAFLAAWQAFVKLAE